MRNIKETEFAFKLRFVKKELDRTYILLALRFCRTLASCFSFQCGLFVSIAHHVLVSMFNQQFLFCPPVIRMGITLLHPLVVTQLTCHHCQRNISQLLPTSGGEPYGRSRMLAKVLLCYSPDPGSTDKAAVSHPPFIKLTRVIQFTWTSLNTLPLFRSKGCRVPCIQFLRIVRAFANEHQALTCFCATVFQVSL